MFLSFCFAFDYPFQLPEQIVQFSFSLGRSDGQIVCPHTLDLILPIIHLSKYMVYFL